MRRILVLCGGAFLTFIFLFGISLSNNHVAAENESGEYDYEYYYDNNTVSEGLYTDEADDMLNDKGYRPGVNTDPQSITVLVNKDYEISSSYVPEELIKPDISFFQNDTDEKRYMRKEAAHAIEKMFSEAAKEGIYLYGVSGYRSFERQTQIYDQKIQTAGPRETCRVSAAPGHSEHQTGLAADISSKGLNGQLTEAFADTAEGKWTIANCYKYGFIVRYPKDKESVTGYLYEPWHIRYVGKKLAKYLNEKDITLEEYYGYE